MDVFTRAIGVYAFGPFRLDPVRRALLRDGTPLKLGARLFDTLLYLVANHDRLVERDELQRAVWQNRTVDENSLGQAISALRKTLQADGTSENFIVTIAGRGYRFGVPVEFEPTGTDVFPATGLATPAKRAADATPNQAASWRPVLRRAALPIIAAGLCLAAVCIVLWWAVPRTGAPAPRASYAPPPHSVAVLAFANLSGDPGQDYFSDGLSEELIDSLGGITGLQVAARTSAFSFKGTPATILDIARALNVATVLEGSVRRNGARLRIEARLIDAATDYPLWSSHYDTSEGEIFKVQGQIASAVTTALQVTLLGDDAARLDVGGTTNPQALDAYLRGMSIKNRRQPGWEQLALAKFGEAVAADAQFALAHAMHAETLTQIAEGFDDSTSDPAALLRAEKEGLAEAELAVSLAPELALAYVTVGDAAQDLFDFQRAGAAYTRAMALAPNDYAAVLHFALFELSLGHLTVAMAAAKHGVELSPLSQSAYLDQVVVLMLARRPDQALEALRHAEQLGIGATVDTDMKAHIYLQKGDMAAAVRTSAGGQDWKQHQFLAVAYHALGRQVDADAQLAKLRGMMGDAGAIQYADIYAQWGRNDDALHWLEEAYRLQDTGLTLIQVDWMLDPVRDTPRFKDIVRRLNFPM
jgi:serine/threonine-protein kinase